MRNKIFLIRGEFLIDIFNKYKTLTKEYDELLKVSHRDKLIKAMIMSDFMTYSGAYTELGDEYPSYLDVEDWVSRKLDLHDPERLGLVMDILSPISEAIISRLDEEVCDITHVSEYLDGDVEIVDFDKGVFIIHMFNRGGPNASIV